MVVHTHEPALRKQMQENYHKGKLEASLSYRVNSKSARDRVVSCLKEKRGGGREGKERKEKNEDTVRHESTPRRSCRTGRRSCAE